MKMFSSYPGCHEVQSTLAEFFQSLDKGRIWWYKSLGDNERSISNILWPDPINTGYFLLASNIVFLKRENPDPVLKVKITEWRKYIDYFGLSIEEDPPRVGKNNVYFVPIDSTPRTSSGKIHISRHQLDKELNLEPPKLRLYQLTKILLLRLRLTYLLIWET